MALSTIKDKVKALLEGIAGMGLVYTYELWASQASDIRTYCSKDGRINFWTIARERTPENRLASRSNERHHHLVIRGYYAVDLRGATENTFETLLETICDTCRVKVNLDGVCEKTDPVQVDRPDPHRYLGDVLCHYAELRVVVHDLIDW